MRDTEGGSWITVELALKGWSGDRNLYVEDLAGRRLLLRLSRVDNLLHLLAAED
ncbi:hypothetical protein [Paenibacillus sp. sgz5001063]|uniref:hypothetical protein n=1 Tax=Paenibacillus sp. sgz5001063 TaxID=3242474 RepID=UPI0036D43AB9